MSGCGPINPLFSGPMTGVNGRDAMVRAACRAVANHTCNSVPGRTEMAMCTISS